MTGEQDPTRTQSTASRLAALGSSGYLKVGVERTPRSEHAPRRQAIGEAIYTQRLSDALGFDANHAHDIGMSATERGLGREMLRGLLNGGLDLSELDITQDDEGDWQVEFATSPVDTGPPTEPV